MGSYKVGTIRKENPVSETAGNPEAKVDVNVETTYQPSDAPEPAEPNPDQTEIEEPTEEEDNTEDED